MKPIRRPLLVLTALASLAAAGPTRGEYRVEILGPVQTSEGELASIRPAAMNARGQVVGFAEVSDTNGLPTVAFRFTPGVGMKNLDPRGGATSRGYWIGPRGEVIGHDHHGPEGASRAFFYSDARGFDTMDRGANRGIRHRLSIVDVNRRGDVLGSTSGPGRVGVGPTYLWRRGQGWVDVAELHPALGNAKVILLNARREMFAGNLDDAAGTGTSAALFSRGRLVPIDAADSGFWPWIIDRRGRLAGGGRGATAYTWSRKRGVESVHPSGFRYSAITAAASNGTIAGEAMGRCGQGIFVRAPGRPVELVASREELRNFGLRCINGHPTLGVEGVNRHHDVVGYFWTHEGRSRAFLLDRDRQFHDLQEIVDTAGADFEVILPIAINNEGRILVAGLEGRRGTAALLTPVR